jgi:hypothetical protein
MAKHIAKQTPQERSQSLHAARADGRRRLVSG